MHDVAIVRYEKPYESLKKSIDLCDGFRDLSKDSKVFIKPNIVTWIEDVDFPKYGVFTTSRLMEDMVTLLKDQGVNDISIGEGMVISEKSKKSKLELAADGLGLNVLKDRYGIKIVDITNRPFVKRNVDDAKLFISKDILEADYVIDMPVLKTHSQAIVSLAMKNLKGTLNIASRKRCHNANQNIGLDYHIAKLASMIPVKLVVIDGIYTLERGPFFNGMAHRSNIIITSRDIVSADKVGAKILGIDPKIIQYIANAAKDKGRPTDLSDINLRGEIDINNALHPHKWVFEQNTKGDLPIFFEKAGIKGIRYPETDNTICTYCSSFIINIIMGILLAKNRDNGFDDIEILNGKIMKPTPGHKHTLLVGQCQVKLNSKNPLINHCVIIPGCPPKMEDFFKAYEVLGIELPDNFTEWIEKSPETLHLKKYKDKPEFDPLFYAVQ